MGTSVNNICQMVTVTRTAPKQGHFTGTRISGGLKNNVPRKVGLVPTVRAVAVARLECHCLESTAQGTGSSVSPICPTAPLTWHRECCLKLQIYCRSPSVTGTDWGLHSPCTLLSCTVGHLARTPPEAGWYSGSSAVTWFWSLSGNHFL